MDGERIIQWAKWGAGIAAAFWDGLPQLTQVLMILMGIDVLFGLLAAVKEHRLSVKIAYDGITKKAVTLGLIYVAAVLSPYATALVGVNLVQAVSAFYCIPELTSITRNAALLGAEVFPQFDAILKYFEAASGNRGDKP